MPYKVTFWNSPDASDRPAKFYLSRSQAIYGMRLYAFEKLRAFAKLDTQAAHDVMAAIERCDDILQPQECRHIQISNTGYSMNLSNTARSNR